jgi:hypothetical protein
MAQQLKEMAERFPKFLEPAKAMVRAWTEGIASFNEGPKPVSVDLSAATFSEEKRSPKKRVSRKIMNPEPFD